ncbi:MAG: esterase/lipase family protein [Acidobacteriota bacterium]
MELVFVHGYSVRNTATYGDLPTRLEREMARLGLPLNIEHIYLGKYVSFNDQVSLDDLSRAFDSAIREKGLTRFACITHSTGGPLVRNWITRHGGARLTHLIMLAPANHGSALAQLGKGRLARIKAFFESVEPGQRILDWLELGSEAQWALNSAWLDFDGPARRLFPFVLTGQSIDRKLYDHLNSYTGEPGSDGVVRAAAANLNYSRVRLLQQPSGELTLVSSRRTAPTPFAILPGLSHCGRSLGIMTSVTLDEAPHPTVATILDCLRVTNEASYQAARHAFALLTKQTQSAEAPASPPHSLVCFRLLDDEGQLLEDYDLLFTAGADASPDRLPKGVFRDRQRNRVHPGRLTYYLDHSRLTNEPIGFEVHARPDSGLIHYAPAHIPPQALGALLRPNEAILVEIILRRRVDRNCFTLTENRAPEPISGAPAGPICQTNPTPSQ